MDDAYVSKTFMLDVETGDTFRCSLGVDTRTRVSYDLTSVLETSQASSFVEQYTITTYKSITTIHNRHKDHHIAVLEKSSVPVAPYEDTRVKVLLRKPEGLAECEDGFRADYKRQDGFDVKWGTGVEEGKEGKKEGKFVWMGSVSPGEEVTLISEWDVRAPFDIGWREHSS